MFSVKSSAVQKATSRCHQRLNYNFKMTFASVRSHHFLEVVLLPTGVFITKGDVGVGTIVGSAVFNILVIIGLSGIFAGQVEQMSASTHQ